MTRREFYTVIVSLLLAPVLKAVEFASFPAVDRPDLLMILAVGLGLLCGPWVSGPAGFFVGLVEDLTVTRAFGVRGVSLGIAALSASALRRFLNPDAFFSRALITFVSVVAGDAVCYGLLRAKGIVVGTAHLQRVLLNSAGWSFFLTTPISYGLKKAAAALLTVAPGDERPDRRMWA